jgi:hypothetical protein
VTHNYIERQDRVDDGQVTEADGYVFGKTTDEGLNISLRPFGSVGAK